MLLRKDTHYMTERTTLILVKHDHASGCQKIQEKSKGILVLIFTISSGFDGPRLQVAVIMMMVFF